MNRIQHFVSVVLITGMVFGLTGCPFKKKKPPVPQPAAQAPTVEPQPAQPSTVEPPASEPKQEEKPQQAEVTPAPKPKPKHKVVHKEPPSPKPEEKPQEQASVTPPRIIIQEGGAKEPTGQISTVTGHDQASHQRMSTAQLLDSTEANLRKLNRTLTAEEQNTVAQIKDYVEQARAATTQQDLVRAHNLALKAHLLSDDLVNR